MRAEPIVPQLPSGRWSSGVRGSGNRTKTPLFARTASGATSRNCSFSEKSPYGFFANQSMPSPPDGFSDPSGWTVNSPEGAWAQS